MIAKVKHTSSPIASELKAEYRAYNHEQIFNLARTIIVLSSIIIPPWLIWDYFIDPDSVAYTAKIRLSLVVINIFLLLLFYYKA